MLVIDVDGVIADSHRVMIDSIRRDGYDVLRDDISAWDFGEMRHKSGLTIPAILDYFHDVWRYRSEEIRPVDDTIVDVVNKILAKYDSCIVTANPVPNVKPWLATAGVDVSRFIVSEAKNHPEYNVFIEDNPTLLGNGHTILLRDQPWNRLARGGTRFSHSQELPALLASIESKLTYRTFV